MVLELAARPPPVAAESTHTHTHTHARTHAHALADGEHLALELVPHPAVAADASPLQTTEDPQVRAV